MGKSRFNEPLVKAAANSLQQAAKIARERTRNTRTPLVIWKDGQVVHESVGEVAAFPAGESLNREFKGWLRLPRARSAALKDQRKGSSAQIKQGIFDLIRTIAALHNADGGEVFVGASNAGELLGDMKGMGVRRERYDAEEVINKILVNHLIPKIHVHPDVVSDRTNTKFALRFRVDAGVTVPAALSKLIRGDGKTYGCGTIFVRTLKGGQISTTQLEEESDWILLLNRCIRNRGSDVIGPAFMEVGTGINRCDPFNLGVFDSDSIDRTAHHTKCIADALGYLDFKEVRDELWQIAEELETRRKNWIARKPAEKDVFDAKDGWGRAFKRVVDRHRGTRFAPKK